MAKITVLIIILFLAVLSVFAFFNKGSVDIMVWKDITLESIPLIVVILISTAFGVLSVSLIVALRDARRYFEGWQLHRQQKKESKTGESYAKGVEATVAGRHEEASELFDRVLNDNPLHANAILRLGDIALKTGDLTKARQMYTKANEINPRSIETLLSLEKLHFSQQRWDEALKYLDTVLEIDSENLAVLKRKRTIYEKKGAWEEIIEVQQKILKSKLSTEEEVKEQRRLLGYKYELGRNNIGSDDTEKAIKSLKSIIKTDKDFISAYVALADAYTKQGSAKEAHDIILKGYEATNSLVLLVRLEDLLITAGEPGTIIDLYQKAIQKNPDDLRLQFLLAKLYYRLEMIDYAYETINAMDTTAIDNPDLHILLGNIQERRSDYQSAISEFKRVLKADKPSLVPFCCATCSYTSEVWTGRCPDCMDWNTFILDTDEICKTQKRQSST